MQPFFQRVHIYFSLQLHHLHDHFENFVVRTACQNLSRTFDLYNVERVGPWTTVRREDWFILCNGWLRILGWTELAQMDDIALVRSPVQRVPPLVGFIEL